LPRHLEPVPKDRASSLSDSGTFPTDLKIFHKKQCGFTDRAAAVLIKAGIDAPERLLPMASDRIRLIQGIGPTLMKEIERYQRQNREAARRTETTLP
jgi:hypothetical protein